MVEDNMGKFKSQIGELQSGGEFLFEHMCTFEEFASMFSKSLNS
jgi:hypothetical protein